MNYSKADLSPYSSHILARHTGTTALADHEIEVTLLLAMDIIMELAATARTVTGRAKASGAVVNAQFIETWSAGPGVDCVACVYEEKRPVTWLSANASKDRLHHLLMITVTVGGLVALTATDAEHRAALISQLSLGNLGPWQLLPEAVFVKSMIENQQIKALWLSGVHRDTSIKPSSKILSGSDLRDAIDPIDDASYLAGAVRSTMGGVSLRNSSVWTGPNVDIHQFEQRTCLLLAAVEAAILANPAPALQVHAALASKVSNISQVNSCYFISHADPETLDNRTQRLKAQDLTDRFFVELSPSSGTLTGPAFQALITEKENPSSQQTVHVQPAVQGERVIYEIAAKPPSPFDDWVAAVANMPMLLKAYYDSGHTIAGGHLASARLQELPFSGFVYGDFTNYDVTKEKPQTSTIVNGKTVTKPLDLTFMTDQADTSLFKWIFKEGLSLLSLGQPKPNTCWLYCDDGSLEVADFIHLDITPKHKRLTLIHAKGATNSSLSRRCCPGPYELVAAQAIKNLRAFDANQLLDRILQRVNGKGPVYDRPWIPNRNPLQTPTSFTRALQRLGANYDCEVVIVQPHVLQSVLNASMGPKKTTGAGQLCTLLYGVEAQARAVNAKFRVVADKR